MDVLNTTTFSNTAATILFDNTILGLILYDQLTDSDWVGDPNSLYSPEPEARWILEPADDQITLESDGRTLVINSLHVGAQRPYADQIRIITSPETVPEPAAAGLVVLAGFSFIGINRFLRRRTGK